MLKRILIASFLLLIFSLPFVQPVNLQFYSSIVQLTDLIFLLTAMLCLIGMIIGRVEIRYSTFYLIAFFYFLAFLLSSIFSNDPVRSFLKLPAEVYLIALCLVAFHIIRSVTEFKYVVVIWIAASAVIGLVTLATVILFYVDRSNPLLTHTLHHYGTLIPGNYPRIQATFYYPAGLCNYLTVALMLLLIAGRNRWLPFWLFVIILVLQGIALAFTITPGLGGVGLAIGLWLWLHFKIKGNLNKSRLSLISGTAIASLFFFAATISPINTPTSPFVLEIPSYGLRIDPAIRVLAWKTATETFLEDPWVGKGLNMSVANAVYQDASGRTQVLTDAHNTWLNVAAQAGIPGLIGIIAITVHFWRKTFPIDFDESEAAIIKNGLGVAFIGAFVFQGLVGSFEEMRHMWVLFGLMMCAERFEDQA